MNKKLNSILGLLWIFGSPIALIYLKYFDKSLHKNHGVLIYILMIIFSILTLLLIPWAIFMFLIISQKGMNLLENNKRKKKL